VARGRLFLLVSTEEFQEMLGKAGDQCSAPIDRPTRVSQSSERRNQLYDADDAIVIVEVASSAYPTKKLSFASPVPRFHVRDASRLRTLAEDFSFGIVVLNAGDLPPADVITSLRAAQPDAWMTVIGVYDTPRELMTVLDLLHAWPVSVVCLSNPPMVDAITCLRQRASVADSARLLPYLTPRLYGVKPRFALSALETYAAPWRIDSLKQIAASSGLGERHCRRLMLDIGVVSSHDFFSAARVLRAWRDARAAADNITAFARSAGFGDVRTLKRQWNSVVGDSFQSSTAGPLTDEYIRRIAARVFRTGNSHAEYRQ
jgi:hypothetical protein